MAFEVKHGIFSSYTGSAIITNGSKMAVTTITGPSDILLKDASYDGLAIEVRVRHFSHSKPFEGMLIGIVDSILDEYVVKEAEEYRSMVVNLYSNTHNLSMICNSVLLACIDGGIPLRRMFYCVGEYDLFVYSNGSIEMQHGLGAIEDGRMDAIENELKYVQEKIEYGNKDMFMIE